MGGCMWRSRRPTRVAPRPRSSARGARGGVVATLDQRVADECGACEARGLRYCAPARAGVESAPPVERAARALSALRQPRDRARERVRLDALQGALPLQRLPGALRLLQVPLRC